MNSFSSPAVRMLTVLLIVTAFILSAAILPDSFSSSAENHAASMQSEQSPERGLPNFDIRTEKTGELAPILDNIRSSAGRDLSSVDALRAKLADGEAGLRHRMPNVVLERDGRIGMTEIISPNVWNGDAQLLTPPSGRGRPDVLRNFLRSNDNLIGLDPTQTDALTVAADYTNPDGNLSYTHLEQRIDGVPVFAGEVKAGFDRNGSIIRVVNNLAPGLDYATVSRDFGNAADAVRAAAQHIDREFAEGELVLNEKASSPMKAIFGKDDWATTAERMYFPTEPGVAVPAWRVLIWGPVDSYYVVVDAASGTMLWRKNITEDQTQAATYNVYRNANAYIDVADSPAPFTPGPNAPDGSQSAVIARETLTLIGNEGTNSFNNLGWINDGANTTDGNANQAGIDRDGFNGVDAAQVGSPSRTFSSTWNPPPGNPAPGDSPLTAQAQRGAVIQMFYVMNRYHDELYKRGFTEAARNFQNDNFGRGGSGLDRVSSEGQDSSGTNNANFSTPADGGRGRMQMYLWVNPNPDRDGTADADIIIHEVTHGTSNRLHANGSGLSTNMARGMGEGWSDFYAHTMLAEPTDPVNGIYTIGGYSTLLGATNYTSNYYYGIRRFPKAVIAFTGPNGKPHSPLTFRHLNSDCNTDINTVGAFGRGPYGSSTCDAVHNAGEIWSSALWEVRALMIARLGFTAGTERILQLVTDGMKLAPTAPTFLQERDAIISAAGTTTADADDVREGFRRRGMGATASIQSTSPAAVTESFAFPGPAPTPTPTPVPGVTVSGFVTKTNGRGLSGATVSLAQQPSGPTITTTTAGDGSYSFAGVATGFTYTITPTANRYTFSPAFIDVLVNGNVSGQNFIGTRQ